jgi:outer membrane protein assembly factor BamA
MRTLNGMFLAAILLSAVMPAAGQKFLPKTIQFKGAPDYSDQELMAAAGLSKGVVLSYAEMNDHSKRLMDSGVFESLTFKFDGQDLIFQVTLSPDLLPVRIENLPLTPGKDLEDKLHKMLPLYLGKVPAEGGLAEDVRGALESMLAAQGIKATVVAAPSGDPKLHNRVTAMTYSITTPPVLVKAVRVDGASAAFHDKIDDIARDAAKSQFDTANSANNLEHAFKIFYEDQGYAAVKVRATRSGNATQTPDAIEVPFAISIEEGRVYKVGAVQLPAGAAVTQAEIDKMLAERPGGPPEGVRLRSLWQLVALRYKAKGNLDCKVTPHPVFDDAAGTVSYTVDVDPGPVYHLAFVKFDNVSDELRAQLIRNWQMLPGDPFDENYVSNFIAKVQMQDPVLRRSLAGVKVKFDVSADQQTHDVNVVLRLEK